MNRLTLHAGLFGLSLLLIGSGARAQSGPGLPKVIYDPSELFTPISVTPTNVHGHSIMHDGYLASGRTNGGLDLFDISNPYDPLLVTTIPQADLVEAHTMAQTTAYGGKHVILLRGPGGLGGTGFAIWDLTDILHPQLESAYDIPGVPGGYGTGVFWMFYQAPYVYCGAGSLGLFIVDASDPTNPVLVNQLPTSTTGGFNAVNTLVIGNHLILTNADAGPGMALFDLSDPLNPQLVHATTTTPVPYGVQFNGGLIWLAAVSGPASEIAGEQTVFEYFEVLDPFTPGFPVVGQFPLPARGASAMIQDGFAHAAASVSYMKLDISDLSNIQQVGSAAQPTAGGDWDWVTPLGNLVSVGDDQAAGTSLIPHQLLPDNTGPTVTFVSPLDGSTNQALSTRVGITLSDMVALESIDLDGFSVRPVGGAALPGSYSNQFGIVNFTPATALLPNTTYEVSVPVGGLRDWSSNAVTTSFTSRFSTGASVTAIIVTARSGAPALPGVAVQFDATASGPGPFQYSWDFGDGTPPSPFSSSSQAVHAYSSPGHYAPVVTASNGQINGTSSYIQTVHNAVTAQRPTRSSTLLIDETQGRVWNVNADNDTVTAIDTGTLLKLAEVAVGAHPRTLAQAPDGALWVVCADDATIHVLDQTTGANLDVIALPYASAPYGIAISPDGGSAYVTLQATGEVAVLDPTTRQLLGTLPVGPQPRGIAVDAASERIFVTRLISAFRLRAPTPGSQIGGWNGVLNGTPRLDPAGEVYELSAAQGALVRTHYLALDPGPDTDSSGRGLPNYLNSLAIAPDGERLWVPSKKDNIQRGSFRDGLPLTFDNSVRTIVSQIDLLQNREVSGARIDFNDRDLAFAVTFSPLGDYAFHVLQGANAVDVRDAYTGALVAGIEGTGLAPQGLVLSGDGATLYVHNFMSRTVTAYDSSGVTSSTSFAMPLLGQVSTVSSEQLAPQVLRGKRIFYNARDARMTKSGYLSCATCHLDGGGDGQVWDFTDRGEGLRNTIPLVGRAGVGQGRVHWTANFDEIQDFEHDMRGPFGGKGFLPDELFSSGTVSVPLGQPKRGLNADLDALAEYVTSLSEFGLSPWRLAGGALTSKAQKGKLLFASLNCAACHSGAGFTDSPSGQIHDVGTLGPGSGQASGGPLTGLDTPTLRGLWASAPYLHDGSAATLRDVFSTRNPGGLHGPTNTLTKQELKRLEAYLLQIDDLEPGPPGG